MPSPLTSATRGLAVGVMSDWPGAENVPSPLPSSTDTVLLSCVCDGQVELAIAGEVAATIASGPAPAS